MLVPTSLPNSTQPRNPNRRTDPVRLLSYDVNDTVKAQRTVTDFFRQPGYKLMKPVSGEREADSQNDLHVFRRVEAVPK